MLLLAAPAYADGLELKGLAPGMTKGEVLKKYPKLTCGRFEGMENCAYFPEFGRESPASRVKELDTLAGVPVNSWSVSFVGTAAGHIGVRLGARHFDHVMQAFRERLGAPREVKNSTVTTNMGVKYEQAEALWGSGDSVISIRRYGSTIDEMVVTLSSQKLALEFGRKQRLKAKEGAADM